MNLPLLGRLGCRRNYLAMQQEMHWHFVSTGADACHREKRARAGDCWGMLYQAYQTHADVMEPVRTWASAALRAIGQPLAGIADNAMLRNLTAAYELIARAGLTHDRPAFGIDKVTVGNREVAVHEHAALTTPFGTLLHFKKDVDIAQPRVLLVAPLSGHFATLLRGTVRTMLPEHDVYITDWHNVRDVPLLHGRFGFDDYIAH